jgi:hypothetical protein
LPTRRASLVGHPLGRIEDDERQVGALERSEGTDGPVPLERRHGAPPLADARRVDQHVRPAPHRDRGVDRIAGGARLGRHDRALLAEEAVQEGRLPDVRPPDEGEPRDGPLAGFRRSGRQRSHDRLAHRLDAATVGRRHGQQLLDPGRMEIDDVARMPPAYRSC